MLLHCQHGKIFHKFGIGKLNLINIELLQMRLVEDPFKWLFSFGCRYTPGRDRYLAVVVWQGSYLYMIAKLLDLLDTIFFVLRKKDSQISFLHIYHHTITFTFSWYYLKYLPGKVRKTFC